MARRAPPLVAISHITLEMFDRVVCHDLGISDHSLILGAINSTTGQRAQKFRQVRCYGKCNLDKQLQELKAAPWHIMDRFPSMNSKWEFCMEGNISQHRRCQHTTSEDQSQRQEYAVDQQGDPNVDEEEKLPMY